MWATFYDKDIFSYEDFLCTEEDKIHDVNEKIRNNWESVMYRDIGSFVCVPHADSTIFNWGKFYKVFSTVIDYDNNMLYIAIEKI